MFSLILSSFIISCYCFLWKKDGPTPIPGTSLIRFNGCLEVITDYKSSNPGKTEIDTTTICNGDSNPEWNIIFLSSRPLQPLDVSEKPIASLIHLLNDTSFCLHAVMHRANSMFKPTTNQGDASHWYDQIERLGKSPSSAKALKNLNIENAARDIIEFAKHLKGTDKSKVQKLAIIGSSYGSVIAHRALALEPNLFDACIFNGYHTFKERHFIEADKGLMLACKDSPICNQVLGPNPELIRNVPSYLLNEGLNECTKILHRFLNDKFGEKSGLMNIKEKLQKYLHVTTNVDINRKLLVLIYHSWTCPNTKIYLELLRTFDESLQVHVQVDLDNRNRGLGYKYAEYSETDKSYWREEPKNCQEKYPLGLNNGCHTWKEKKLIYEKIKSYLYEADSPPLSSQPVNSEKTKIYIIHNRENMETPLSCVEREMEHVKAPLKRFFILNYGDPELTFNASCSQDIINEVFGKGTESETDECIKDYNEPEEIFEFERKYGHAISWAEVDDPNLPKVSINESHE